MASSHRTRRPGGAGVAPWVAALALAALACAGTPAAGPPGDPRAQVHFGQGEELLAKGRFEEAARELEQAAALAPSWAQARLELGWARFHAGAHAAAEADFRAAVGLDPREARSHRALGSALYVLGRYGEAAGALERWVDLSGGPSRAGDAAILWALALRRDGGASAVKANEFLEQWTSPSTRWVQFSGVAAGHELVGSAKTLGQYLLDGETEEDVLAARWGTDARRAFSRYVVAANLLAQGKLAGARERLQKLAEPSADDDLAALVIRAFARADLKALP